MPGMFTIMYLGNSSLRICSRSEAVNPTNAYEYGLSFPTGYTAFKALLTARIVSAIWSHISDCDETFNYWEPVSDRNRKSSSFQLLNLGQFWSICRNEPKFPSFEITNDRNTTRC